MKLEICGLHYLYFIVNNWVKQQEYGRTQLQFVQKGPRLGRKTRQWVCLEKIGEWKFGPLRQPWYTQVQGATEKRASKNGHSKLWRIVNSCFVLMLVVCVAWLGCGQGGLLEKGQSASTLAKSCEREGKSEQAVAVLQVWHLAEVAEEVSTRWSCPSGARR